MLCQACLSPPILMTSDKTAPDWLATKETPKPSSARTLMGSRKGRDFHSLSMPSQAAVSHHLPSAPASQKPFPSSLGCSTHSSLGLRRLADGFSPLTPLTPQVRPGSSSRKFGLPAGLQGSSLSPIWVEPPCPNMVKSEHTACPGIKTPQAGT